MGRPQRGRDQGDNRLAGSVGDVGSIGRVTPSDTGWIDELDLSPDAAHPVMGTRSLGNRPWLVADDLREAELALKRHLLDRDHAAVFAVGPHISAASVAVLDLVTEALAAGIEGCEPMVVPAEQRAGLHPLEAAGRLVQEDLCLLQRRAEGWVLAGASVCFPSQWRPADKLGRPMAAVHGPVPGYETDLDRRVTSLFDALVAGAPERVVWRRNWFLRARWDLFQPDRDPSPVTVPADRCPHDLFLRSERQTLRPVAVPGVGPGSGWILFTIRTQHAPLSALLADDGRRSALRRFLSDASDELAAAHGITVDQRRELAGPST